ncbi:response regulator transcription factor [Hansschlegelia plantiphila]|uniref:DNA-binding response regulator n=1 Tax=Hansschlegelia plantiphila TaxID=374655 RepID=A0A9W6J2B3_9HYPH|nr:response regulator transcription factor [Hansschlegelia plantiphila]GLK67985.1 DNA-binding response regulator [Hansschlegelia plantiphila]
MNRALVIDDHPIVLEGCRRVLLDAGFQEVLEAATVLSGFQLYRQFRPELVIVDLAIRGSGLAGLSLIRRLRLHDETTPILVFSMHGDPIIASRAFKAGATGFLAKDMGPKTFLEAIEKVRRSQPYIGHEMAVQVALLGSRARRDPSNLTAREIQTLALLGEGKAYGQIADELGISYKTVANTCSNLKEKLKATTLQDLVRIAVMRRVSA